ncbi:hypothetical protein [uncultured Rhodospira sp.]|uniref:hypothetical protein n=1 Tax=uncultured Rhodospira sp. TaxID=1936189 RepID=UPI002638CB04|nr:hypothetical protein [uncultured Rhodospira sp.]
MDVLPLPRGRRRRVMMVAAALAVPLDAAEAQTDANAAFAWLDRFYAGGPFCSTAVVKRVERAPPSVIVHLDIDPRWAADLARMEAGLRDGWFALHCPYVLEPVWSLLPPEGDVIIHGAGPDLGVVRHSCRRSLGR